MYKLSTCFTYSPSALIRCHVTEHLKSLVTGLAVGRVDSVHATPDRGAVVLEVKAVTGSL